jgi:hypothetical protein
MNPSIEHRLDSMIRAMSEIVIPALGPDSGLAKEQAGLVLGHLHVLRQQIDQAPRFDRVENDHLKALGASLVAIAEGGSETRHAIGQLVEALGAGPGDDNATGLAIEALIRAAAVDGSTSFRKGLAPLVLDHGRKSSDRNRVWFAGMRFEGGESELSSLESVLT